MISLTGMDYSLLTRNTIWVIFKMEQWKVMAFGKIRKEKNMWANGKIIRLTAMASTSLRKVTIKVFLYIWKAISIDLSSMAMASSNLQMEKSIVVIM